MQFLISQFAFPETKTEQETYVGIVPKFDSPFHLYINLKDLEESSYVKIIIFSLGAKKEILWGTFSTTTNKFDLRANCKYTLNQLTSFLKEWSSFGFESVANSVADRIHIAMNSFNPDSKLLTESEYKVLKYFIAYVDNKITFDEFEKMDPDNEFERIINKLGIIEEDEYTDPLVNRIDLVYLNKNIEKIREHIVKHEKTINRTDIDKDTLRGIINHQNLLQTIVDKFYEEVKSGPYNNNSFYLAMEKCESRKVCEKSSSEACDIYDFMESRNVQLM